MSKIELRVQNFFIMITEKGLKRAEDWMLTLHKFSQEIKEKI